ncbi:MAG: DNA mismatch repair protein [Clostridia bacterium]|nr:DNA mismatch repair protein [Clostridia bacterium]
MDSDFSLLYPKNAESVSTTLSTESCNDLSLEYICDHITESEYEQNIIKKMMMKIESNPEVIRYRCDVFEDILRFPKLRERIKELLEELNYLKELEKSVKDQTAAPVWQLINRLQELDVYVNCIAGINESLTENAIQSVGLKEMRDYVSSVYNESGFEYLNEDIKGLMKEISAIRSLSLGVNLDSRMRPVEVGIVSLNNEPFSRPGLLGKFLDFASKKNEIHNGTSFDGMMKIHTVGKVAGDDPLMSTLSRVVTEMLGSTVKQLKNKLSRYVNISGYSLTKLIPEFIFYIRWAEYVDKIMALGIPMAKPEIMELEKRELSAKGIYNLKLAIQCESGKKIDIIRNDFDFNAEHGIYIMTGPNRGGKTTFTQAVGLLFLLAQHGIYVPAEAASLSPVDNIYTHFPADENQTVNLGRLGEESKRLSAIFAQATNKSLLLFNESLATTSFAEGLYIAKDVVRALRYLGARTIFNTHMHELAMELDLMNSLEGDIKVASLITGIHEGQRSYKVFLAPPEGVSYARDIAEKYGVTFEQLTNSIRQ